MAHKRTILSAETACKSRPRRRALSVFDGEFAGHAQTYTGAGTMRSAWSNAVRACRIDYETKIYVDFNLQRKYESRCLAHRGRVLETIPECGARCGRPAMRLVNAAPGGHKRVHARLDALWGTARRAIRPGCEELAARAAEDNAADGSAAHRQKPPRWSAERRASYVTGRRASRKRPGVQRYCMPNRVPLHPGACRRSAHPSWWGFNSTPGRNCAAGTNRAI
jgi:hypothetical protein